MTTTTTRIQADVPSDLAEGLRALALARGASEDDLVTEALSLLVGAPGGADAERAVDEGRADIAAGRFVEHAEVARWLRSWGTPDELPPPVPRG